MAKRVSLTVAIAGDYNGKAIDRAAEGLRRLNVEAARNTEGISQSFARTGDALKALGNGVQHAGGKLQSLGADITKATAPIAAAGAASVKLASDYDKSVTKVYTIMDKGVMSTSKMSDSILDLSTKTGRSASELADATYQALSASVATEKVGAFVEDAVKLSKAGFTETATAVDTLTTVINAYGYKAEDAQMISNRLVQTQNKGKTTVDELASSIGNVIPTAAAYNVNLDNLCSAYVVMTKQGINTANATTAINGMLTELSDEGSTVAAVLRDKTGKSFGQLMADGADLGSVIQILSDSVDGDSEAFANLWGNVCASKGALAIANAGSAEFTGTMNDMANSAGLVDKALEDLQTPAARASKAVNALKNTGIKLGEEIMGAAVPALDGLAAKAQGLYRWFSDFDDGTKQAIVRFGALALAAGPVTTALGAVMKGVGGFLSTMGNGMQSIGAFTAAMKQAEAAMRAGGAESVTLAQKLRGAADSTGLLTKAGGLLKGSLATLGIGAAVAAVGLLAAKFAEWQEHCEQVDKATRGLEGAMGAAKAAYDAYTPSVESAGQALNNVKVNADECLKSQAELADKMNQTWTDVGTNSALVDHYAGVIAELGNKGNLTAQEQVHLRTAVDEFNKATGASIEIVNEQTGELNTSREAVLGMADAYREEAKAAAAKEMLVDINKQMLQDEMALKQAQDELTAAEREYERALRENPEAAYSFASAVDSAQRKVNDMSASLESARNTEQQLVDVIASSPPRFATFEQALDSCGVGVQDLGDVSDETLAEIRASFDGSLASIVKACHDHGVAIPEGLSGGMGETSSKAVDSARSLAERTTAAAKRALGIASPSKVFREIGANVGEGLSGGIESKRSGITSLVESIASAMRARMAGLPSYARGVGSDSSGSLASGLQSNVWGVGAAAAALGNSAERGVSGVPGAFGSAGSSASSSFGSGLSSSSDYAYSSGRYLAMTGANGMGSVDAYNTGWNMSVGFANGMGAVNIWDAAYNVGRSALYAIKSALGIASPSKEAAKVGEWFGEGAIVGMKRVEGALQAETDRLSDIMTLQPTAYGTFAAPGAYGSLPQRAPGDVYLSVELNVSASSASEGKAVGKGIVDGIYEEIMRKRGSSLWDASYSPA